MAFTDQILNSILKDKQRILQKTENLLEDRIIEKTPLVNVVGRGKLLSGVLDIEQIENIQERLQTQLPTLCPTPSESENIIRLKTSLEEKFLQVLKKTENARRVSRSLSTLITAITTTITILKTLPVPNTFTTAGLILTLGDLLDTIKILLDRFRTQVQGLEYVANSTDQTILELSQKLQLVDNILTICNYSNIGTVSTNEELQSLVTTLNEENYRQPLQETYKNYLIKVENDRNSPQVAPRRYAIVISQLGATVYKGPPSFSSSTQVLIDEAKFYIDQLEN